MAEIISDCGRRLIELDLVKVKHSYNDRGSTEQTMGLIPFECEIIRLKAYNRVHLIFVLADIDVIDWAFVWKYLITMFAFDIIQNVSNYCQD